MGEDVLAKRVLWGAERRLRYEQQKSSRRWLGALLTAAVAMAAAIYAASLNPEGHIHSKTRQILDMLFEAW